MITPDQIVPKFLVKHECATQAKNYVPQSSLVPWQVSVTVDSTLHSYQILRKHIIRYPITAYITVGGDRGDYTPWERLVDDR